MALNQELLQSAINSGGGVVPGEGLTANPDSPYPWEGEVKYTVVNDALNAIFLELTEPEQYQSTIDILKKNVPIGDIMNTIIYKGFTQGLWNPELALLLIEPVMYLLYSIAVKAGIDNPVIDDEDDTSDIAEQTSQLEKIINIAKDKVVPKIQQGDIPQEIVQQVASLPEQPSLLEPTQNMPEQNSLLGRGE